MDKLCIRKLVKRVSHKALGTGTLADFNVFPVCHFELCWILVIKVENVQTLIGRGGAAGGGRGSVMVTLT